MKNYLFIFIAITLFGTACHGKNNVIKRPIILTDSTKYQIKRYKNLADFNADTVAYIKYNFIENKFNYTGKNLELLFKQLEVPVVLFTTVSKVSSRTNALDTLVGISLIFFSNQNMDNKIRKKIDPGVLTVYFDKKLMFRNVIPIIKQSNNRWNEVAYAFFKSMQIKDIQLVLYDFKKKWTREELDKKFPLKKGN